MTKWNRQTVTFSFVILLLNVRNNQILSWICSRRSTTSWCLCYQSYDQWLLAEKISFTSNTCKATLPMQHFSWRCCMPRRDNLSLEVIILIHMLLVSYSYIIHIIRWSKIVEVLGKTDYFEERNFARMMRMINYSESYEDTPQDKSTIVLLHILVTHFWPLHL